MKLSEIEKIALELATKAHEDQTRKYNGMPYIVHPIDVRKQFHFWGADYVRNNYPEVILHCAYAACFLHDTFEDTTLTEADILKAYHYLPHGGYIVSMVSNLTDTAKKLYPYANRAERKAIDGARIASVEEWPDITHIIKICDITCNVIDFVDNDPQYALTYIAEKQKYIKFLQALPQDQHHFKQTIELTLLNELERAKTLINISKDEGRV